MAAEHGKDKHASGAVTSMNPPGEQVTGNEAFESAVGS